jgi:hypothetical protein
VIVTTHQCAREGQNLLDTAVWMSGLILGSSPRTKGPRMTMLVVARMAVLDTAISFPPALCHPAGASVGFN